jgi:phage shock protein PspC (stress-responsive transcriptional regulator)
MSMADELEKLYRLLQSGALTQSEYDAAKARLLAGTASNPWLAVNRVRRSEDDKWIAGVCGGAAKVTGVEAWIWRLIFVLGMLAGGFTGVLYIILWILVPREGQ